MTPDIFSALTAAWPESPLPEQAKSIRKHKPDCGCVVCKYSRNEVVQFARERKVQYTGKHYYVPDEVHNRLRHLSTVSARSLSDLVRQAMEEFATKMELTYGVTAEDWRK